MLNDFAATAHRVVKPQGPSFVTSFTAHLCLGEYAGFILIQAATADSDETTPGALDPFTRPI